MNNWENATLEYNRTSSAPLQEEVLVAVLISRCPKEVRTYLHVQVREDTARLSHVRQLLYDYLRAGKAWKAPRTEETAETNSPNSVPMDVEIISYTSYSRTNDCIYNGYDNINLEPNAMNTIDTVAHMNMHYTQY